MAIMDIGILTGFKPKNKSLAKVKWGIVVVVAEYSANTSETHTFVSSKNKRRERERERDTDPGVIASLPFLTNCCLYKRCCFQATRTQALGGKARIHSVKLMIMQTKNIFHIWKRVEIFRGLFMKTSEEK